MNEPAPQPLLAGLRAAKANFLPGLMIQLLIVAIVVAYYRYPAMREALVGLADFKLRSGYFYALLAGVIAGGLLPEALVVLFFQKGRISHANVKNFLFMATVWGIGSVMVDAFYRLQTAFFGTDTDLGTISLKMLVDQFVYTPLIAMPYSVLTYKWRNGDLPSPSEFFTVSYYWKEMVPSQIANWGVWIPLVCLVYAMPAPLQIPLYSLILTFWVLLFSWINRKPAPQQEENEATTG